MTHGLPDDLLLSLAAASALAIALSSCRWHRRRPTVDQQRPDDAPVIPAAEQHDRKSTRSKERRRRGKDPLRDLFKGGKKSQALLKAIKTDHDIQPSADTLSNSSAPSSTSRSQSPEPAGDLLHMRLGAETDDGSARCITPNGNTSSASAVTSPGDISDHGSSDAFSQTDDIRAHSVPLDPTTTIDTEAEVTSVSTIVVAHASEETPSFPLVPADAPTPETRNSQAAATSGSCAKLVRARTRLRLSRMDPGVKPSLLSSTPPPLADSVASLSHSIHSDVSCPSLSVISSTHSTDGAGPPTPTNSRGSTPPPRSLSPSESSTQPLDESAANAQIQLASMRTALEAAHIREEQLRIAAEQASKERDELRWRWNEDAGVWRRREAELQAQIHHLMQQLQAYAAVASFQAQQASSAFSSPTSPHAHSSPRLQHHPLVSFPPPPAIQPQNSTSAPAHVQALLACAPMLTPHSPGFAAPSGGLYSGPGPSMSPLWSGQGLCVPNWDARHGGRQTPDSSASGSSSRGRRRRRRAENAKSASDESSLGDWDGMEDGSGDEDMWEEEEEDIFRNNALADAILKRPESIRGLSGSVGKRRVQNGGRPPMHGMGGGVGERMDALKDPALDKAAR